MKVLVLNSGSSSLKFRLIETSPEQVDSESDRLIAHGEVSRIGEPDSSVKYEVTGGARNSQTRGIPDHKQAIAAAFECMRESEDVLGDLQEIAAVGHRIVHGGEEFYRSTLITDEVLRSIEKYSELAPLHNPANLKGIYASRELLPHASNVAVFDTAFHHKLPPRAYRYGLPDEFYARDRIRRYGFHGISHRYVSGRFGKIQGSSRDKFKLITCHLGNGCSVCAIDHGISVDCSMGFTPLEGLLMGTRSGDLDPGIVLYLLEHKKMSVEDVSRALNERAGLLGISGIAGDMRDLTVKASQGAAQAQLAIDVFCYRVKKYIGAYLAALNGADAIILAGGIGENAPAIRAQIFECLDVFGLRVNPEANAQAMAVEKKISPNEAAPEIWVIPTDEERLIARDTVCVISGQEHD